MYQLIDVDTNEVMVEGTASTITKHGFNASSVANAVRKNRLYLGKYSIKVTKTCPKSFPAMKKPRLKVKTHKKPESNFLAMAEINRKAAEQGMSYGQYMAMISRTL